VQVRLWCRAWRDVLTDHTRYQQDAERRSCQEGASLRQVADRTSCDTEDMSLSAARTADTCRRASNVIQNSSWTETSTEDGLLYGLMVRLALWPHMFWSSSAEQVRPHLVSYLVSYPDRWTYGTPVTGYSACLSTLFCKRSGMEGKCVYVWSRSTYAACTLYYFGDTVDRAELQRTIS